MECIVAKIFGSESQKEAAIELFMKTHGGRAFLHGHLFGDNVHEFLAPCIYEGEGEMLGMAFFKSLVKEHGKTFFEPIGKALQAAGIRKPNPLNPAHAWALRKALWPVWKMAGITAAAACFAADASADATSLERSRGIRRGPAWTRGRGDQQRMSKHQLTLPIGSAACPSYRNEFRTR